MGSKKWILCVDDDEEGLLVRKLLLEQRGYAVATATDADAALSMLRAVNFDLVLTDHYLNGKLGTHLAADIKRNRPTLPVILLTGAIERPEGVEHVDALLPKAQHPNLLFHTVATLLAA